MHPDGCAGPVLERERSAYVVDVCVGDDDLRKRQVQRLQTAQQADACAFAARVDVQTGIDHHGSLGIEVVKQCTVAAQQADWESFAHDPGHASIVRQQYARIGSGSRTAILFLWQFAMNGPSGT